MGYGVGRAISAEYVWGACCAGVGNRRGILQLGRDLHSCDSGHVLVLGRPRDEITWRGWLVADRSRGNIMRERRWRPMGPGQVDT